MVYFVRSRPDTVSLPHIPPPGCRGWGVDGPVSSGHRRALKEVGEDTGSSYCLWTRCKWRVTDIPGFPTLGRTWTQGLDLTHDVRPHSPCVLHTVSSMSTVYTKDVPDSTVEGPPVCSPRS